MKLGKKWEPYASGSFLMGIWFLVLLKLILRYSWSDSLFLGAVSALLFFLVSVLVFETGKFKGGF